MKKTSLVIVGLFMLLMLPGVSFSDTSSVTTIATTTQGPYISGQLGASILSDSDLTASNGTAKDAFNSGFATDIAAGYNFGMFRLEAEVGYQRNEINKVTICYKGSCGSGNSSADASAFSGLANVYIDFVNRSPLTPYISGGIGVARIDANDFREGGTLIGNGSTNGEVFAYQAGVGLAFAINQHLAIDLKYRYFATTDLDVANGKYTFQSNNIYCGFRYNF